MATAINRDTAIAIYNAIALFNPEATTDYLAGFLGLNINTVRIYCRWLAKQGCIRISKSGVNNVYVAIAPLPRITPTDERLARIVAILEPYTQHPKSWDKTTKAGIIEAIQKATKVACN